MLELAILGLLKERAMHGYELRKQLGQKLGLFWTVSFGSLYPTLRRLERRGAVQKVAAEAGMRRKQVYRITARGEGEFLELLEGGQSPAWEEDKFTLRLAFFRYLRPEMRVRLLERRRAYLVEKLDEGRRSLGRAKRSRTDSYTLSLMRHGMEVTENDVAWLDELISAERAQLGGAPSDAADDPEVADSTVADRPSEAPDPEEEFDDVGDRNGEPTSLQAK